jgi:hydroxypyruvate isomerase
MRHRLDHLVNCSILFGELPLLERPAAARAAGFDAVEFWWPFATATPDDVEVDRFVAAVRDAGVRLVGLNLAAGDMPAGDRGLVSLPGREQELAASIDVAVDIGGRLGTSVLNALYGNRAEEVDAQQQDDLAAENLAAAATAAARIGAVVLVEAVSGAPRYPLRTAAEVLAVLDRVQRDAGVELRLLADLYHLSVNGDDVAAVVRQHSARIGHVQIADAPGRHEPGTGTLPLDEHLSALEQSGYAGWVSLEYVPTGATTDSFHWLPPERRPAGAGAARPAAAGPGET